MDGLGICVGLNSNYSLLDARQSMDRAASANALGDYTQCAVFCLGPDGRGAIFCLPRGGPTDWPGLACGRAQFRVLFAGGRFFEPTTEDWHADAPKNFDVCLDCLDVFGLVNGDDIDLRYVICSLI